MPGICVCTTVQCFYTTKYGSLARMLCFESFRASRGRMKPQCLHICTTMMQQMKKSHALSPAPFHLPWQLLGLLSNKQLMMLSPDFIFTHHCRLIPCPTCLSSTDQKHKVATALGLLTVASGMLATALASEAMLAMPMLRGAYGLLRAALGMQIPMQ